MGKESSGGTEFPSRRADIQQRMQPEAKSPVIVGGTVNKNECIGVPSDTNAIPKRDVHMTCIEVFVLRFVQETTVVGFRDSSIGTKRGGEFTTINPFTIPTDL